ncbi:MAG TPA: DUF805 domain-containing protein [Myxococcales bacterium]|jgi:uncharacterized membrane protein YhaH (DUF805 family)|nr:DUF805 domain-containing protein [Myxococcales bacterium]
MDWYISVFKRYAQFTGRARRKEYWMFTLISLLVTFALWLPGLVSSTFGFLYELYSIAALVPSLAVTARRLHDTGRSAWWMCIALVPLVGAIILLVFLCTDGAAGDNQYGLNPKSAPVEAQLA